MLIEDCFNVFLFDTDDDDVDSEASPNLSTGIKFSHLFLLFWDSSVTKNENKVTYENKVALLLELQLKRFYDNIYKAYMLGLSDVFKSSLQNKKFQAIHLQI